MDNKVIPYIRREVATCVQCAFWKPQSEEEIRPDTWGECRRYAPAPFKHKPVGDAPEPEKWASWPRVAGFDWCGEYVETRSWNDEKNDWEELHIIPR